MRRTPYTERGIRRVPCTVCGASSRTQWQVCGDGNQYRGLCIDHDVALNEMVMDWMGLVFYPATYRAELEARTGFAPEPVLVQGYWCSPVNTGAAALEQGQLVVIDQPPRLQVREERRRHVRSLPAEQVCDGENLDLREPSPVDRPGVVTGLASNLDHAGGHEWLPRDKTQDPKVCPRCKSPYWNTPRRSARK